MWKCLFMHFEASKPVYTPSLQYKLLGMKDHHEL